jgi:5-methylcytosine-specific restriction endonuclease McrA
VNRVLPKQHRVRLDPEAYDHLRKQVLRRDAWRCQICGSGQNLQVHHKHLRSRQGSDDDSNLITLCSRCHSLVHRCSI